MHLSKKLLAPLTVVILGFGAISCGGSGGSADSFCSTFLKFKDSDSLDFSGLADKSAAKKVQAAFDELESNAPAEIKDDIKTLAEAMDVIAGLDTKNPTAMAEAAKKLDQKKVEAASERLEKYTEKNCKP